MPRAIRKKLLIATHNPTKLERYQLLLARLKEIEPVSLRRLGISQKVEETESTVRGNAIKKAVEYSKMSGLPALAIDEELFIDALPPDKQPGVNVRRIVGHEATDEELLQAILELLGGLRFEKRGCTWNFAIALARPDGRVDVREVSLKEYFATEPKLPIKPGYPLSSLLYSPKLRKYQVEYTREEELERLSEVRQAVEQLVLTLRNL